MKLRFLAAAVVALALTSCATDRPKNKQVKTYDQKAINYHLEDLVYDSSVFGAAIGFIHAGKVDVAMNRLELAQDATILKLDDLIPYAEPATQMQVIRELQSIKAARRQHPRRPFVGSGESYDTAISNIVNRAQAVLDRVEE